MNTFIDLTPEETTGAHAVLTSVERAAREMSITLATGEPAELNHAEAVLRSSMLDLRFFMDGIGIGVAPLFAKERTAALEALELSLKGMEVAQELVDKGLASTSPQELEKMHTQRAALQKLVAQLEQGASS